MTPDELYKLEEDLRASALNVRIAALNTLAAQPAAVAVPILQNLSKDPSFLLRRLAVMGLGNQAPDQIAFDSLQALIADETDANVLAEAANSLYEFGDASIPLLVQMFEANNNWLLRQTVLSILQESNHPDVLLDVSLRALEDETQTVKETAILGLRQVLMSPLQAQALATLAKLAQSEFWRDRWRAATALTGCDHPQAAELLSKLRTDENHYVVAAALDASMGTGL
ncbi:HEAT repeat domain-containing protein [Leptolyngbya cf. ectocarpi LEGE 11479]|uniref:HEAT repeat domain-containing protein n=1 Tax=Leptolyngbya cf. ectocarpi LEGE 11479 TaxID=1828722 RepID=A0A928ZY06_LEPEC|nr:HEAT repeat domain-containing protein [Leptolyngbya ectocarpi]MBE9069520.1 HEAT repeat domain-containing protein [Leptolyngbya cf. ectocarpi LEGE 11479]